MLRDLWNILGMHPRVLVDGFEIAKRATLQFLEKFKTPVVMGNEPDREILKMVARTTVRTKVNLFHFILFYGI
jgi:T-complex protein 1 subunit zeta